MDILFEWFGFLTRWLHVMAGITWIGTSFYFNWFDSNVRPAKSSVIKENSRGTLDEIHGGSFYYHEQYWPDQHPERLLVHAWPAKTTFYTGLLLMTLIYWFGASAYLVDKSVADITGPIAVAISVGAIVLGWAIYTKLSDFLKEDKHLFFAMSVFVIAATYILTHLLSGRGAFISTGAMLGSFMGLNVIFHIVPNHIAMRRQLANGEKLDIHHGYLAKRRSQHNNYFTIPVVFCMISNHFATAYSHQLAWIILSLMLFAGWAIRHYLNVYYKQDTKLKPLAVAACVAIASAIGLSMLKSSSVPVNNSTNASTEVSIVTDQKAMQIIHQRCVACHSATPSQPGFSVAPQGLMLDTVDQVLQHRQKVIQQALVAKSMPLGNLTQMTDEERALLQVWFESKK